MNRWQGQDEKDSENGFTIVGYHPAMDVEGQAHSGSIVPNPAISACTKVCNSNQSVQCLSVTEIHEEHWNIHHIAGGHNGEAPGSGADFLLALSRMKSLMPNFWQQFNSMIRRIR
jgi:hypothetical protein